jgi:hypothetical protein
MSLTREVDMPYRTPRGKQAMLFTVPHVVAHHIAIAAEDHGMSKTAYMSAVMSAALSQEPAVRKAMSEAMAAYDPPSIPVVRIPVSA